MCVNIWNECVFDSMPECKLREIEIHFVHLPGAKLIQWHLSAKASPHPPSGAYEWLPYKEIKASTSHNYRQKRVTICTCIIFLQCTCVP